MQRDRLPYLLIPLAALIAILPLLLNGCSCGHDFDFHLLNWMEAARQFTHGNLHPHWAYTAAYNAGEPRFVFYPPASWTIGAILGLLLPWTWTPIVYTWLALTLSGFAMHHLAREFSAPTPALIASIFYAVNPYMLFTAYERTAYAELLAAAWIPLLLHAILRKQITIPRIAIPVALLWITNAPAAVMSCYALALLAAIRLAYPFRHASSLQSTSCEPAEPATSTEANHNPIPTHPIENETATLKKQLVISTEANHGLIVSRAVEKPASLHTSPHTFTQSRLHQAGNTIAGTALGLGLAAFYIVPAAYERRFVQIAMALVPGMRIQDNFLFHHTSDIPHDEVLHTASLIAILLIAATCLVIAVSVVASLAQRSLTQKNKPATPNDPKEETSSRSKRSEVERSPHSARARTNSHQSFLLPALATLTLAITLLLTPVTAFIWRHLPELAFLQFPWRLIAILAAVLSLSIALALPSFRLNPAITTALAISLAASLTYPSYLAFGQSCDPEDTVSARLALFRSNQGSEPTDEYTPTTADNDSLAQSNPAYWLSPNPNAKALASTTPGPAPTHLTLNSPIPQTLILNLRDYPSWHLTLNGARLVSRIGEARNEQDQRDDGLIAIPLPAGASTLNITYAQTLDQTLGDAISLASLALLFLLLRTARKGTII